jgi:UDP-2,3-diacylglucosamine hydrolase
VPKQSTTIVVSDAHLGQQADRTRDSFHRFLRAVPDLGDHLLINGDLFEFWFEYRQVIPRSAFATLSVLAEVREKGVRLTVMGGNHDRWGLGFWSDELGAEFHSGHARMELSGWQTWVAHGDGFSELDSKGKILHRITRHKLTAAAFRLIHPDLAFGLVTRMSSRLAARNSEDLAARAAAAQAEFARNILDREPKVDLVILGHTHRPALESIDDGRWYLNPGAWMEGHRYAVVTTDGPELKTFE